MTVCVAVMSCSNVMAQTMQEWRDSLAELNRQIAAKPYSSDLHLRKAAINLQLYQWEYAIDEYTLVLGKEPQNLAALYYRAYANTNLRRYELAKNDYLAFLAVTPYNMEARLGLAHTYMKLKQNGEAMDEMNRLVEQFPDSCIVFAARAALEKDLKAYDAALYDWNQAIRLQPGNADYMISKVDVLLLMGKKSEAKTVLDGMVSGGTPRGLLREWYDKCEK